MSNIAKVKKTSATQAEIDMATLWQESMADDDFRFEIRAQSVAVDLVRAISELGLTQSQVAKKLGWKPSRVSHVLHGASNVTLRTLHDFVTALGLEFDVIYRRADERRVPQRWELQTMVDDVLSVRREIDSLRDNALSNLNASKTMLDTARQLVRRGWSVAKISATPPKVARQETLREGNVAKVSATTKTKPIRLLEAA